MGLFVLLGLWEFVGQGGQSGGGREECREKVWWVVEYWGRGQAGW